MMQESDSKLYQGCVFIISFFGITMLGREWASRDSALLPPKERERLEVMGLVGILFDSVNPKRMGRFCGILAIWIVCVIAWFFWHVGVDEGYF